MVPSAWSILVIWVLLSSVENNHGLLKMELERVQCRKIKTIRIQHTSPNFIPYCILSLSTAFAFSACSLASRFQASHVILAWFHDSSHDANLLRNDKTSSVSRCTSRLLEFPLRFPLPNARGDVREGDWNLGEDIMSYKFSGCDLGLRTKPALEPDYKKNKENMRLWAMKETLK